MTSTDLSKTIDAIVVKHRLKSCLGSVIDEFFEEKCPYMPQTIQEVIDAFFHAIERPFEVGREIYKRFIEATNPIASNWNLDQIEAFKRLPHVKALMDKVDNPLTFLYLFLVGEERFAHLYSQHRRLLALPVITISGVCRIYTDCIWLPSLRQTSTVQRRRSRRLRRNGRKRPGKKFRR